MPEGHVNMGGSHVAKSTGAVPFTGADPVTMAGYPEDNAPTGAVPFSGAEPTTVESAPYWDEPTGAMSNPPETVTVSQWPGDEPAPASGEASQPVEEKSMGGGVVEPDSKPKRATAKKGRR